jgi:hypothetical protein
MNTQPLLLHHYTSGSGLLGIFDSDSVWATLIHSLNDSKEFGHAIDQTRAYLFSLRHRSSDNTLNSLSEGLAESLEQISQLNVYVACFSALEDSLSQWRGYCPPGFGYSLGLFGDELRRLAGTQGFQLHQCIYDHNEQRHVIEQWVSHALQDLRTSLLDGADPAKHASDNGHKYLASFAAFAPVLKNHAFKDEHEWRLIALISADDPRVKLRPGRSMLIPYVPIKLGLASNQSLVWNIRIGPTPNMVLAANAATRLFRRAHIKNGIGPSMVPYREW